MTKGHQRTKLRLACPPCGEVFTAEDEDTLMAKAVEHARKFHDIDLLTEHGSEGLRTLVRRENESYWARIAHLIPDGEVKTVLDEKLGDREREIASYVVHGFPNRQIAERLFISKRTVHTAGRDKDIGISGQLPGQMASTRTSAGIHSGIPSELC